MRILLLGSGGREHALAIALAGDPMTQDLTIAPGNPGTARVGRNVDIDITDPDAVLRLAQEVAADLVVVGPEAPLVAGVADRLRGAGIGVFGPSADAAKLESSKAFAKDVMAAAGIPTAMARIAQHPAEVDAALDAFGPPYVVKDDGLAAGKGVLVTSDRAAARDHALACLSAPAGRVVIEEYLDGPEVSLFFVCDGHSAVPLRAAQDFKRLGDGDEGPNTGGMGAYAPLAWLPDGFAEDVRRRVAQPALAELVRRGTPFTGLLYAGLALTGRGIRVIEFNARFGDPETQVVTDLLESSLPELLAAAAHGRLADHPKLRWREGAAVFVVLAAAGYPGRARTGDPIAGAGGQCVRHAGTALAPDGQLVSAGGRVLGVLGRGADVAAARADAYRALGGIELAGGQYRRDIAAGAGDVVVPPACSAHPGADGVAP